MRCSRAFGLIATAWAIVIGSIVPGGAAAAAPPPAEYVRTAYDGTIWELTEESITPLTWNDWIARGKPGYRPASTVYVKVLSMATVYAVTAFSELPEEQLVEPITAKQYRAAGGPKVIPVDWVDGISLTKWQTSAELIAIDPNGYSQKLTYAQWRAAGFPAYDDKPNRGFIRMSWDSTGAIAYMCDIRAGRGGRLTYQQWVSLGAPAPQTATRTRNDIVSQISGTAGIDYWGPVTATYDPGRIPMSVPLRRLSYAEWRGMGSPAPSHSNIHYPENFTCSTLQPAPWD